jgi:hypothetical protein
MISDTVGDWQELSALYEHADRIAPAELSAWVRGLRADRHRLLPRIELKHLLTANATDVEPGVSAAMDGTAGLAAASGIERATGAGLANAFDALSKA